MTTLRRSRLAASFGSLRVLAIGAGAIVAVGITTGVAAELLSPNQVATSAAASAAGSPGQQRDVETKRSLVAISQAIETYYITSAGPLTLEQGTGEAVLKHEGQLVGTVKVADGTAIQTFSAADYSSWCIDATNEHGSGRTFSMSSDTGLTEASCGTAAATHLG